MYVYYSNFFFGKRKPIYLQFGQTVEEPVTDLGGHNLCPKSGLTTRLQ